MSDDRNDISRPHVPDELQKKLDDRVREHTRAPPDRFPFADRLKILLEEYDKLSDENAGLENELENAREELSQARSGGVLNRR